MPINGNEASLYFHIPFCTKKCPYCHFYVLPNQSASKKELLEAFSMEWQFRLKELQGKEIISIYFGGGTPTLFGAQPLKTILDWIRRDCVISKNCEITLEANPEDVTADLMREFAQVGINRISIGVQSLDDTLLMELGRGHSAQKAIEAVEITHRVGIQNISIDLMYDLPKQTLHSWEKTLKALTALPITHLSLYNLTFEPHTLFFKKKESLTPLLPSQDLSLILLQTAVRALENLNLKRYEISAFAKEGYFSKHNTGYWIARPFLGFGPSAFSYWNKKRFRNRAHLKNYKEDLSCGLSPVDFEEELPFPENIQELLAVELRLLQGVNLIDFQKRHGSLAEHLFASLDGLEHKGWLQKTSPHSIALTEQGILFYDSVAEELI